MARFMIKASEFKNICKAENDRLFEEIRNEMIEILKKQDEKEVKKAIDYFNSQELHYTHLEKSFNGKWIEKAGYGVGTVRIWKGKKYKKIAPGKWARVFDKEGRGTNIAMGKLLSELKKIPKGDYEKLMEFSLMNKQRFVDENGIDLPVLDKLRAAVDAKNTGDMGSKGTVKQAEKYDDDKAYKEYQKLLMKENPTTADNERLGELVTEHYKHSKKEWIGGKGLKELKAAKDEDEVLSNGKTVKEVREQYGIESKKTSEKKEESKTYWIQDSRGNRLTNEDAKKRLMAEIENLKEYKNEYLLDRLNPEDRKEIESEFEKTKNRSDAMKGDKNGLLAKPEKKESDFDIDSIKGQTGAVAMLKDQMETWPKEKLTEFYNDKLEKIKNNKVPSVAMQNVKNQFVAAKELLNEKYKNDESETENNQNRSDAVRMTKEELKKYVMDKANEYYKNNEAALTKKANEAVEKMTAAECNKETQLTDKNSLGMFVDKFNESGKTPTDKELQELAYNVVLSRVAAAQWGDKNRKELDEQNEAEQKQKEEAINQKEKEIKEKYHGYFDSRSGLDKARDLKTLEKKYNFDGKVMSSKEFVEQAMDNGVEINEREVNKLDYPSRTRWNRMNGYEQDEYEKRIKAAGKKTVYSINGFEFPKTVVDYAKFYKENGKSKTGNEKPSKSEIAIKNKATSLAGAFGYSKTYAEKMGSPFNLELAEQTVDEELDWDEGSKKSLKEELKRIYSEKKVQKSLFDDFVMDMFIDEDEEIEDAIKTDESLFNDYSAEQPELFNSTEMMVREAFNRCRVL